MNILNEIDGLRKMYETQFKEAQDKLTAKIDTNERKLRDINNYDYAKEYVETYEQSLSSLENIYNEWLTIQRKTKGISFYVDEYIKTLRYEMIPKGMVEEFFADLVKKCRSAIIAVQQSKSVEDDIAPQKIFCQCLVNLRYIVKNGRSLINDTSLIEESRERDSKKFKEDLAKYKEQLSKLSWIDLPCKEYIENIKVELMKNYTNIESKLIGNRLCNNGEVDYNFLMGFKEENVSNENRKFIKDILDVPANLLASTPIYYNPKKTKGALLIRASAKYFESESFLNFMNNIYFSFTSSLPAKGLHFAGIEKTADAVIRSTESQVKKALGNNFVFGGKVAIETTEIETLVKSLMAEYTRRSEVYRALDDVSNVFKYNEVTPDNKHPIILFCINKYPVGITEVNNSTISDIKTLLEKGYEKGIITVLCQVDEQNYYTDATPIFDPNTMKVDYIDINSDEVKYNGVNITTDITIQGFKHNKFFKDIEESNKNISASMSLEKLIEEENKNNFKPKPFTEAISVPFGNYDGHWYSYDFKTCSTSVFGLLLGKSGSGKSAFIHTMMLSAAYYYPPDELQFYLVDFKDKDNSPEFSNYIQNTNEKNIYIPHVRYLSVKSKLESAMDLLNKMEVMVSERSKQIKKLKKGTPDINVYNASEEVKSGKLPKIPQVFFIIDEYKTMLEGGADVDSSSVDYMVIERISSKLQNLMTRLRAFGIGVIFLGQEVASGIKGTAFNQISTRIAFNMGSGDELKSIYNFNNDFDAPAYYASRLIEKGNALISGNGGVSLNLVRMAYSGQTGGSQQLRIAEIIREKYKDNPASKFTQVEAGSEDLTPIVDIDAFDDAGLYLEDELDEGNYYIPLGVSSASSLKMSLCYSSSKKASNYIAYANENKIFNIERNALFGFMEKGYDESEAYFAGTINDMKKFVRPYVDVKNKIDNNINFITNKTEICKKLIALRRLYDERSIEAEEDDISFKPIFMVLHDISWLTEAEGDPNWLPQNVTSNKKEKVKADSNEVDDVSNTLSSMGVGNGLDMLADLIAGTPEKIEEKDDSDYEIFTLNDVKNALFTLHKKGNQYGIFLLISAIKPSTVEDLLNEDRDNICKNYMVYGSYDLYKDLNSTVSEGENCVYLLPVGSKTRLFDYDADCYGQWWDKF